MPVVYINGKLHRSLRTAQVSFQDRGYQFADAIYEVIPYIGGVPIDLAGHLNRLEASAEQICLTLPMPRIALAYWIDRVRMENRVTQGLVYIQVSRGPAARDFLFGQKHQHPLTPVVVISAKSVPGLSQQPKPISVCFMHDWRWARVDIKTTGLLAPSLAKTQAYQLGFDDAWLVDREGYVSEATAANAWIITREGVIKTPPREQEILCGVTRQLILAAAEKLKLEVRDEKFTPEQALGAQAAFVSSATAVVTPVAKIESVSLNPEGNTLWLELRSALLAELAALEHTNYVHWHTQQSPWQNPKAQQKQNRLYIQ